jgi:hypothetical protein
LRLAVFFAAMIAIIFLFPAHPKGAIKKIAAITGNTTFILDGFILWSPFLKPLLMEVVNPFIHMPVF